MYGFKFCSHTHHRFNNKHSCFTLRRCMSNYLNKLKAQVIWGTPLSIAIMKEQLYKRLKTCSVSLWRPSRRVSSNPLWTKVTYIISYIYCIKITIGNHCINIPITKKTNKKEQKSEHVKCKYHLSMQRLQLPETIKISHIWAKKKNTWSSRTRTFHVHQ